MYRHFRDGPLSSPRERDTGVLHDLHRQGEARLLARASYFIPREKPKLSGRLGERPPPPSDHLLSTRAEAQRHWNSLGRPWGSINARAIKLNPTRPTVAGPTVSGPGGQRLILEHQPVAEGRPDTTWLWGRGRHYTRSSPAPAQIPGSDLRASRGPKVTRGRLKWGAAPTPGHQHRGGGQATTGRLPCLDAFRRAAGPGRGQPASVSGDAEAPRQRRAASRDTPAGALQEGP